MTGMEAWNLIAPIISPMEHQEFNNKDMCEAFITCYIALKEYRDLQEPENNFDYITFCEERGLF